MTSSLRLSLAVVLAVACSGVVVAQQPPATSEARPQLKPLRDFIASMPSHAESLRQFCSDEQRDQRRKQRQDFRERLATQSSMALVVNSQDARTGLRNDFSKLEEAVESFESACCSNLGTLDELQKGLVGFAERLDSDISKTLQDSQAAIKELQGTSQLLKKDIERLEDQRREIQTRNKDNMIAVLRDTKWFE